MRQSKVHQPDERPRARPRTVALLALIVALTVLGVSACRSESSRTYTVDEVQDAFAREGYPLIQKRPPAGIGATSDGEYLAPRNDDPLIVLVLTDEEGAEAWSGYTAVGPAAETLTVRRANVLAISDGGLPAGARIRVRRAMEALPDRGVPVDQLEDR